MWSLTVIKHLELYWLTVVGSWSLLVFKSFFKNSLFQPQKDSNFLPHCRLHVCNKEVVCGTLALSSCSTTRLHTILAFLDMSACSPSWGIKRQTRTRSSCPAGQKLVMWLSLTDTKPLLKKCRTYGELEKKPKQNTHTAMWSGAWKHKS